jgi:hypothetical protein
MNLLILLMAVVILLLIVIISLLVTRWPGKQREEIERLGNGLRREMAEQRSESLQLMKSLRIVVEDAVKESVEKELASAPPRSRSRKGTRKKGQEVEPGSTQETTTAEDEADNGGYESPLQAMQIPLFSEKPVPAQPSAAPTTANNQSEAETIHMGFVDDIPEVE